MTVDGRLLTAKIAFWDENLAVGGHPSAVIRRRQVTLLLPYTPLVG